MMEKNNLEKFVPVKLCEIENGDRTIVISEKGNRIIIAQKQVGVSNGKPIDIFFKHPLSIHRTLLKKFLIKLIEVL